MTSPSYNGINSVSTFNKVKKKNKKYGVINIYECVCVDKGIWRKFQYTLSDNIMYMHFIYIKYVNNIVLYVTLIL